MPQSLGLRIVHVFLCFLAFVVLGGRGRGGWGRGHPYHGEFTDYREVPPYTLLFPVSPTQNNAHKTSAAQARVPPPPPSPSSSLSTLQQNADFGKLRGFVSQLPTVGNLLQAWCVHHIFCRYESLHAASSREHAVAGASKGRCGTHTRSRDTSSR